MKKYLFVLILGLMSVMLFGCGKSSVEPVTEEVTETIEETEEETEEVTETEKAEETNTSGDAISTVTDASPNNADDSQPENLIRLENDGVNGTHINEDGMKKDPVITNKELDYKFTTGDFEISVTGSQLSSFTALTQEVADALGVEANKECIIFAIDVTVENKSDKDETLSINQSTIVTNTKEQVESMEAVSDVVGGDFYGNVVKEGQIFFVCTKSDINELNHIKWRVDSPQINGEDVGEPLVVEFELIKE